MLQKTNHMD